LRYTIKVRAALLRVNCTAPGSPFIIYIPAAVPMRERILALCQGIARSEGEGTTRVLPVHGRTESFIQGVASHHKLLDLIDRSKALKVSGRETITLKLQYQ
jgi:hypothetical protein